MGEPATYDEFGLFHENAEEYGIPWRGQPEVRRVSLPVTPDGRRLSALAWGAAPPVTMMTPSSNAVTKVIRRYAAGETRGSLPSTDLTTIGS